MTDPKRIVVISDLHMGSPSRALFTAHDALANFIDHLTASPAPVELVILGDAVDFLQFDEAPHKALDFTAAAAAKKAKEIVAGHDDVFEALAGFLKAPGHTLRWFVGNHDIELLFEAVREVFEGAMGTKASPAGPLRWHLDGEAHDYALCNGAHVRVRHGNSADPWNDIDYAAAQKVADAGGSANYPYPPGSRLVAGVINPLKAKRFKHIDLLKPELTVAIPLSLALWPADTREYLRTVFPSFFEAQAKGAARRLSNWAAGRRPTLDAGASAPVPSGPPTDDDLLAAALHDIVVMDDTARAQNLADDLTKVLRNEADAKRAAAARATPSPARDVYGDGTFKGFVSSLLHDAARRANDRSSPWALDEPDDLYGVAENTVADASARVAVLIAGHTHLARAMELPGGYYLNPGTWADLMSIPRNLDGMAFGGYAGSLLELLGDPTKAPWSLRPFKRLTWVEVAITDDVKRPWEASLREWPTETPRTMHRFP